MFYWIRRAAILLFFVAFPSSAGVGLFPISDAPIQIDAVAVPLSEIQPALRQTGKLIFEGGWSLKGTSEYFGSWSGMTVAAGKFTLVSDYGAMVQFDAPAGQFRNARLFPLPEGCGERWNKRKSDAESLTADPELGKMWVSLENQNMICRIDPETRQVERVVRPDAIRHWSSASGPETLARLSDGRFILIAEGDPGTDGWTMPALLYDGDPTDPVPQYHRWRFRPPKGFWPVDAAELPDGRILVLVRRASLTTQFTARLVAIAPGAIKAGAIVEGEEIARFEPPIIADNFEAIAIDRDAGGIAVWIVSDDNFLFLQRSLLLKFRIAD
jgi:hypothetical protein